MKRVFRSATSGVCRGGGSAGDHTRLGRKRLVRRRTTASDPTLLEEAQESLQRFDEPAAAQEFEALQRSPDVVWRRGAETQVGPIDAQAYVEADADLGAAGPARGVPAPPANDYATPWTQLGPGNIGGRTRSLVIHPTTPTTMWAGAVAGGVWKTTDGGASWAPLDDMMANLAVSSMALDLTNPNVLYAGTGEGFYNGDVVRGAGIFKSTNGGTTWTQLPSTTSTSSTTSTTSSSARPTASRCTPPPALACTAASTAV